MTGRILVVDDELSMREFLNILLLNEGYQVDMAENGSRAISMLKNQEYDVVLTDLKMKKISGLDVLRESKKINPSAQVILLTAFATVETALEAMKKDAYDYVIKPFKVDALKAVVHKAHEKASLLQENFRLRKELESRSRLDQMIGKSEVMRDVFELILRVASTKTTILINGESGTGKELVARAIHNSSNRASRTFVVVNCGAIPEALLESELFGYLKGAFTGADKAKKGLFEAAHQGTIFLDEIGELSLQMQVALLRVLQEKTIKPVGGLKEISIDTRIIAATNKVLSEEVKAGNFREDLYYRLNVIPIVLPPLRKRALDIPLLIQHFLEKYNQEMDKNIQQVSPEAMKLMVNYPYPGNVRELENIIERAVTLEPHDQIMVETLPDHLMQKRRLIQLSSDIEIPENGFDLECIVETLERNLLIKALKRANGVRTEAARILGISFRSMRYRLEKYSISESDYS